MLALYRKYRPEKFSELIGQEITRETLQAEVANGLLAHAYLFVGPRGTGKTSTARILSAAVNCEKPKGGEPCTACAHCKSIRAGSYLDLIEIDAASQTGVDNVRENIIESARFVPQVGKWKVYLIDEAHMLSTAAWNALLKTLEEPPERVMFIFATTEPRKIPDTILSRCQQFRFKPVPFDVLKKRLVYLVKEEGAAVEDKVLDEIALRAGGYIRDAESLLGQVLSLGEKKIGWDDAAGIIGHTSIDVVQGLLANILTGDAKEAVAALDALREEGVDLHRLPGHVLDILRAMHFKALTGVDHQIVVKRYGSEGLKAVKELMAINADAIPLRRALNTIVERQANARDIPPELFLEILFAELAEIFSGTNVQSPPTPLSSWKPKADRISKGAEDGQGDSIAPPSLGLQNDKKGIKRGGVLKLEAEPVAEKKELPKNILKFELQAIKDLWSTFVDKVHIRNRALQFILRTAEPLRVDNNHIHLGVHYQFHLEKLGEANNRKIVEETLTELLGGPVVVRLELLTSEAVATEAPVVEEDPHVSQLMNLFGGKVVES